VLGMGGDDMFWCLLVGGDIGLEESVRVAFSLEEGVTEDNVIDVFHQRVVHEIFVDEEEDG